MLCFKIQTAKSRTVNSFCLKTYFFQNFNLMRTYIVNTFHYITAFFTSLGINQSLKYDTRSLGSRAIFKSSQHSTSSCCLLTWIVPVLMGNNGRVNYLNLKSAACVSIMVILYCISLQVHKGCFYVKYMSLGYFT